MEQNLESCCEKIKDKLSSNSDSRPKRNQFLQCLYNALEVIIYFNHVIYSIRKKSTRMPCVGKMMDWLFDSISPPSLLKRCSKSN